PPSLAEAGETKPAERADIPWQAHETTHLCAKLHNEGEFLIQDSENEDSVILSVFKDGVRDFLITIEYTDDGARFRVGAMRFESLSELTFQLKFITCGDETIRLGTAIYRHESFGRFGAHSFVEEKSRVALRTVLPLPELKLKSVVVALKKEIVHHGIDKELEQLILLKHRNLVPLLDFAFYSLRDPVILRYEAHDALSLHEVIRKESFIKPAKTLKWIYQAAFACVLFGS
ncbi:hypothetical protein OSTOST_09605, partial [Ostertagia ostertagi]